MRQLQRMHYEQKLMADLHKWAGKNLFVGGDTVKNPFTRLSTEPGKKVKVTMMKDDQH